MTLNILFKRKPLIYAFLRKKLIVLNRPQSFVQKSLTFENYKTEKNSILLLQKLRDLFR